jgi:hypothetical protein
MIQPQTLQNPAVAAAFESFVPIAPAAGGQPPRFAQTLAHLASAYNTFSSPGILQGPNANQIQLAYQMMQMNSNPNTHAQQMANMAGLVTPEVSLKHPITPSIKQGPLTSTATVTTTTKGVTYMPTQPQTATPSTPSPATTMSQMTRDHSAGMRSPYSTTTTNSSLPISSPPCTSVFSVYTTAAVTAQNTQQAYLASTDHLDPVLYNHKTLQSPTENLIPSSVTSSPGTRNSTSPKTMYYSTNSGAVSHMTTTPHESQVMDHHYDTSNYTTSESSMSSTYSKTNERTIVTPLETSVSTLTTDHSEPVRAATNPLSHCSFATEQPQKVLAVSPNGHDNTTKEVKPKKHRPTNRESNNISPLRTSTLSSEQKMNFSTENAGSSNSKPCTKSSVLSPVEVPSTSTSTKREGSSIISDSKSRTIASNDSIIPTTKTKYGSDNVNYYATNPLLGMKRSCEAIEVYPDPPENMDCNGDDERDDYCSSNEDITERDPICDDPPTGSVRDLRQHGMGS